MPVTITSPLSEIFTDRPLKLLTNLTGSCIALEINADYTLHLKPDESVYYDLIVNEDLSSPYYNVSIIQEYIDNKILSSTFVDLSEPIPEVVSIQGGTFSAIVNNNKTIKFVNKEYGQQTNHLEILPVLDSQKNVAVIYYRDIEGISYSLNKGASSVLISNDNLKYPDEITSIAVQVYETKNSTKVYAKLFVGTLREGIKCFIPGKDTTYTDLVNLDKISGELIFKKSPETFAPVYVVGILNDTDTCPLIVFSRAHKQYYLKSLFDLTTVWEEFNTVLPKNLADIIRTTTFVDNTLVVAYSDELGNNHIAYLEKTATVANILSPTQEKITGLSTFTEPFTLAKYIFLTVDNAVWKYTFNTSSWSLLLHKDADLVNINTKYLNTYLNTSLQFATVANECKIPLTGLVNFSLAKISDTEFLGCVASNIGLIQYWFTYVNNELKLKISSSFATRQINTKIYNSRLTDLVIPAGTSTIIGCNIKTVVPVEYKTYTNNIVPYLSYVPSENNFDFTYFKRNNFTTLTHQLELKPNFFSKSTKDTASLGQVDQVIDTKSYMNDNLRLILNVNGSLYSTNTLNYYNKFKTLFETSDELLFGYLISSRAFGKYVFFYIDHVATRSLVINKITYTITGVSTYYVPIYNVAYSLNEYED
jgi:hypothetical protein